MRIGVAIEETWGFFQEIYNDLQQHHEIDLFKRRHVKPPFFYERANRFLFQRDMNALLRANQVVFFEWASHLLAEAAALPKQCGIVTRLHRYEMYKWVDQINWNHVDKIILVSQAKKREFLQKFPDQASRIEVVTEAVDPQKYQFQPKPFQGDIGILCHLTPRKRVYELVLTFYELLQQRSDLHLHIGGGEHVRYGDYYFALRDLVNKLNIAPKVTFYGRVQDAKAWYHHVDVFISNAYSEGLQVSPPEAMASGCYCLSHHWAGADELLPEDYLYFTDRELQQKLLHYCDLPESSKQEQLVKLRSLVQQDFNVHNTKTQIRQIIEQVGQ